MTISPDSVIASLAGRQHGIVSRAQLLEAGLTSSSIKSRVRRRRLRPVHRGVYQVGPVIAPDAKKMAAVLACGPRAYVSHESAAATWRLLRHLPDRAPVDVLVPAVERHVRLGIRVHRAERIEPDEVTELRGVPVTTPARTLLDLASVLRARGLEQAVALAEREGLVTPAEVSVITNRHPTRRGAGVLQALLRKQGPLDLTRSEAERRFEELIRKAQLPKPELNVRPEPGLPEVDFLWRAEKLIVEVDGKAFHLSPRAFESDRRKDARLGPRGFQVIRVTWRQMEHEPEATIVRVAQTLTARSKGNGLR